MTARSDLRKLDEEIARMRGWARGRGGGSGVALGCWYPDRDNSPLSDRVWHEQRLALTDHLARRGVDPLDDRLNPPPFSSSWTLAGQLLEEMPRGWVDMFGDSPKAGWWDGRLRASVFSAATPCEAIARAWVAWMRGKA